MQDEFGESDARLNHALSPTSLAKTIDPETVKLKFDDYDAMLAEAAVLVWCRAGPAGVRVVVLQILACAAHLGRAAVE